MGLSRPVERAVYNILRLSVAISLIIIAVGILGIFYKLYVQGSLSSRVLAFNGASISDLAVLIFKGDPMGILALSAIALIAGVVISITATLAFSLKMGDKSLAIVSALLIVLLIMSVYVSLLIRSRS